MTLGLVNARTPSEVFLVDVVEKSRTCGKNENTSKIHIGIG